MKNKSIKMIIISLLVVASVPLSSVACKEKQKEIQLTSGIKQQLNIDEKDSLKLTKIRELNFGDKKYTPICWKDNDNIIATESVKRSSEFHEVAKAYIDDINVYNINTKTSEVSKLSTLTKAMCGDVLNCCDKQGGNSSFLYIKDKKLWIYDIKENTQKEIYDLSNILKIKRDVKGSYNKTEEELLTEIHCGFVKGSDKYVYVLSKIADYDANIFIIDLSSGKVTKNVFNPGYLPGVEDGINQFSVAYSKSENKFYLSSIFYNVIYQVDTNKFVGIKKIKTTGGQFFKVSEDGNEFYLSAMNGKKTSLLKYNIKEDKVTEILSDNMRNTSKNQISLYTVGNLNSKKNIIGYNIENATFKSNYKEFVESKTISYIANLDGTKIKNINPLPVEKIDNKNITNSVIFNEAGDKLIYTVCYYDYKDEKVQVTNIKSYVYEVK